MMRSLFLLALLTLLSTAFILQELPLDRFERSDSTFSRESRSPWRLLPNRYMIGGGIRPDAN
ncbi:hypothetical protein PRIPAC_89393 [Pristionchus pacificus]|uniref:Uncharacterized protein n=1 Tax=Pristionchus pacificus TaxID=54126 RepID=A0A2A6CJ54_PRIPA|nr:hypothetical protein PRIPAC_89393 [Pristionchus pacificus]|eukprot:PDM78107.1 hypothetical protein PRIPAC_30492 [Pristionchus pacificus]